MLPTTVRIKRLPHCAHQTAQQNRARDTVYGILSLFGCQSHASPGAINSYLRLISFSPRHGRTGWTLWTLGMSVTGADRIGSEYPRPGPVSTPSSSQTVILSHCTPVPYARVVAPSPTRPQAACRDKICWSIQSEILPFVINYCRVRTRNRAGTPCGHLHEGKVS